eukprot:TRINITY_DN2536_c0_g1_i1.p1 TRINITY_DN2536_c0_g1~~TRINITY_DN2536_c0_g1_i1.p1  ORF type:complete len:251 (+),score=61.34 TRINITY_DN2536_c0_g1_i1:52-804(+)
MTTSSSSSHNEEEMDDNHHHAIDLSVKIGSFVLPGDPIGKITDLKVRIGPGLSQNKDLINAIKPGFIKYSKIHKFYWVEGNQKRYEPAVEDMVVGIVLEKYGDNYKVDIDGSVPATLSILSFEGASRRNKLTIPNGAPIYARVAVANKDFEPEIVCVSQKNKADGYGELMGGFVFQVSIGHALSMMKPTCYLLKALGNITSFEIAVGMNGRVWINSANILDTISSFYWTCSKYDETNVLSVESARKYNII